MVNEVLDIENRELSVNDQIDLLEVALMATFPVIDIPVTHKFTDGLYSRCIEAPTGCRFTSLLHKSNHQFAILKGKVTIYSENEGQITIEAPCIGITYPGTRRAFYVHEACTFATFHPVSIKPESDSPEDIEIAVQKITDLIIEPQDNPYLKEIEKQMLTLENQEV